MTLSFSLILFVQCKFVGPAVMCEGLSCTQLHGLVVDQRCRGAETQNIPGETQRDTSVLQIHNGRHHDGQRNSSRSQKALLLSYPLTAHVSSAICKNIAASFQTHHYLQVMAFRCLLHLSSVHPQVPSSISWCCGNQSCCCSHRQSCWHPFF